MSVISAPVPEAVPALPPSEDGERYEIVDGKRVELPPVSFYATWIASRLLSFLNLWNHPKDLGNVVSEAPFRLPLPKERQRQPDVAFVSYQRWPKSRPLHRTDRAWSVAPDLAVEVVSPNDLAEEAHGKVREYLQAGARLVWVIYPLLSEVVVFTPTTEARCLQRQHELDGGDVLPGFQLPLKDLFPEEPPSQPPPA